MSEEMIVHNCSPTLAGLKTANLFNCSFDSEWEMTASLRRWNEALSGKGICMIPLRKSAKRALVYVYRPGRLARDLLDPRAQEILRSNGYSCKSMGSCLKELIQRLKTQEEFPHEIGLFLGYPTEDVRLFIENEAKNYKFVGCWKVYGNEAEARKTFAKFKKCTDVYSRLQAKGTSVVRLTVAT